MIYSFDVVFVDSGEAEPYNRKTLESQAMGGTEATVIRVAEALGSLGVQVAVIKANDSDSGIVWPKIEPIYGQFAFYLGEDYADQIETRHAIFLRGPLHLEWFPKAKKYIWLHDKADARIDTWVNILSEFKPLIIGVSKWHENNIKEFLPNYNHVTYVYNPVNDELYVDKPREKIDRNLMVWASSPHKGLAHALDVFAEVKKVLPMMQLLIYNPGYVKQGVVINPGVLFYGPTNSKNVWHNLKKSLCLFYPSHFNETFGLVFAEANAVGTPVLGFKDAGAISEVAEGELVDTDEEIVSTLVKWHEQGPPIITPKPQFRLRSVIQKWLAVFAKRG